MPYQSLQSNVTKLEQIHQALDILRRMSRFVILTRRLEVQLTEMNKSEGAEIDIGKTSKEVSGSSGVSDVNRSGTPALADIEDEKERTIAKAALTVAELSEISRPKIVIPGLMWRL